MKAEHFNEYWLVKRSVMCWKRVKNPSISCLKDLHNGAKSSSRFFHDLNGSSSSINIKKKLMKKN